MNEFKVGDLVFIKSAEKIGIINTLPDDKGAFVLVEGAIFLRYFLISDLERYIPVNKKGGCKVLFVGDAGSNEVSCKDIEPCSAKRDKNCEWRYLKSLKSVRTKCGGHLGVCEVSAESFEELKIPKWHEFCGYCSGKVVLRKKKMRIGDIEVPTPIRDGEGFVLNLGERSIKSTIYGLQEYSYEQGLVFATKEDAEKMLQALTVLVNDAWQDAEND